MYTTVLTVNIKNIYIIYFSHSCSIFIMIHLQLVTFQWKVWLKLLFHADKISKQKKGAPPKICYHQNSEISSLIYSTRLAASFFHLHDLPSALIFLFPCGPPPKTMSSYTNWPFYDETDPLHALALSSARRNLSWFKIIIRNKSHHDSPGFTKLMESEDKFAYTFDLVVEMRVLATWCILAQHWTGFFDRIWRVQIPFLQWVSKQLLHLWRKCVIQNLRKAKTKKQLNPKWKAGKVEGGEERQAFSKSKQVTYSQSDTRTFIPRSVFFAVF